MNNCLFWALYKRCTQGGKLTWYSARTWWGFHVTWTDPTTGVEWEYTVQNKAWRGWWYIPLLYRGVIKTKSRKNCK